MDGFPVMAMVEQDPTLIAFHKRTTKHQGPLIKQQDIKNKKCEGPMRYNKNKHIIPIYTVANQQK